MQATILLDSDENTKKVEEEEKSKFIRDNLEQMGIPVDEFWTSSDRALTIEEKIKLREILSAYNIIVIDSLDGHMQMYVENDLVAEWHKPAYKLKTDLRHLNPQKRLFLEMTINCWSVFEEHQDTE